MFSYIKQFVTCRPNCIRNPPAFSPCMLILEFDSISPIYGILAQFYSCGVGWQESLHASKRPCPWYWPVLKKVVRDILPRGRSRRGQAPADPKTADPKMTRKRLGLDSTH